MHFENPLLRQILKIYLILYYFSVYNVISKT